MNAIVHELRAFFSASILTAAEATPPEPESATRRRRIVVVITMTVGAIALGLALAIRPGDPLFYPATLGVAVIWAAGALLSGRLHLGRSRTRAGGNGRGILQGFLLGLMLLAVFLAGAVVVARIPVLAGPVQDLLDHARYGSLAVVALMTAINGVAEELFFRGAVYSAHPRRFAIPGSTIVYAASTLFSGVPLLTFAAVCLGILTAAQRRATGGVLGPITSHLTWSLGMLFLLPPVMSLGASIV